MLQKDHLEEAVKGKHGLLLELQEPSAGSEEGSRRGRQELSQEGQSCEPGKAQGLEFILKAEREEWIHQGNGYK